MKFVIGTMYCTGVRYQCKVQPGRRWWKDEEWVDRKSIESKGSVSTRMRKCWDNWVKQACQAKSRAFALMNHDVKETFVKVQHVTHDESWGCRINAGWARCSRTCCWSATKTPGLSQLQLCLISWWQIDCLKAVFVQCGDFDEVQSEKRTDLSL